MTKIEDRVGSKDAPQDYIYTVDFLFDGEESLVDYFLNNKLADKVSFVFINVAVKMKKRKRHSSCVLVIPYLFSFQEIEEKVEISRHFKERFPIFNEFEEICNQNQNSPCMLKMNGEDDDDDNNDEIIKKINSGMFKNVTSRNDRSRSSITSPRTAMRSTCGSESIKDEMWKTTRP